jgi:hypothetical protein
MIQTVAHGPLSHCIHFAQAKNGKEDGKRKIYQNLISNPWKFVFHRKNVTEYWRRLSFSN